MPYPHKASRAPRKDPIALQNLPLPPRIRPTARVRIRSASRRGAFDVIVEAFDDVAGARLFEVRGLVAVDLVFERSLAAERGCQKVFCTIAGFGRVETMFLSNRRFFCSVSLRSRLSFS